MPGVPQEMTTVMSEEVIPRLCAKFRTDAIVHRTFTVQNYPESVLAEEIGILGNGITCLSKTGLFTKTGFDSFKIDGTWAESVAR